MSAVLNNWVKGWLCTFPSLFYLADNESRHSIKDKKKKKKKSKEVRYEKLDYISDRQASNRAIVLFWGCASHPKCTNSL